jgi:hypothetical protein
MAASRRFLIWFFALASAAVLLSVIFNIAADYYILHRREGASVQLVSGFERVLKPAWLAAIKPDMVFIGSSRIRMGFDPTLIDPEFHTRGFNYGVSSASAYETRRFIQDAVNTPSVKTIVVSLDAFTFGSAAQPYGSGFDELRFAVTPQGAKTSYRAFWLFAARYLGGGALGMHALGVWLLAQLGAHQSAADRPDLFAAYSQMTPTEFRKDMGRREGRGMHLATWNRSEVRQALNALCPSDVKTFWFFPPDNFAVTARYVANDANGFIAFKQTILADVLAHNARCKNKVRLFDFMTLNSISADKSAAQGGKSPYYSDLVHFRPQTGVMLLHRMLGDQPKDAVGDELTRNPNAVARIADIHAQAKAWAKMR